METTTDPPVALFVSPHLDDVAFSCSGTLAGLKRRGWRVAVATVFTASVPEPTGFALDCQLDKGLGPEVDYMELRRREDFDFGRELGVDSLDWLDLPEAPHRGYNSATSLFDRVRPDDRISVEVGRRLDSLIRELQPEWIFAPQAIGNHVDHRQVVRAILDERADWGTRIAWYRDLPYAARFPLADASPDLASSLDEVACPLAAEDLATKYLGSSRYTSQVPFQFGGVDAIRRVLGDFAALEGVRLGELGPVEAFWVEPDSVDDWNARIRNPG